MTFEEYQNEAVKTAHTFNAQYAAIGLAEEVGEYLSHVKKEEFHGRDEQYDAKLEELGDVLWYLNLACISQGTSLEEIAKRQIAKARKRHGDKYNPAFYHVESKK